MSADQIRLLDRARGEVRWWPMHTYLQHLKKIKLKTGKDRGNPQFVEVSSDYVYTPHTPPTLTEEQLKKKGPDAPVVQEGERSDIPGETAHERYVRLKHLEESKQQSQKNNK